jgi:2-polyprenyl-3-methyl-5-hydroxy-6-metoxy-1,4-benzoquinol methylase
MRKVIRELTPPVVYRAAKSIAQKRLRRRAVEQHGEKGPDWYDGSFEDNAHWAEHYSLSSYYFLWTVLSDRIPNLPERTIFDVGCGSGQLASLLADRGAANYCGIDFSPKRIAQAKRVCPKFRFEVADAFETNLFTDYPYDTAISTEFLEHVEQDLLMLEKLRSGTHFIGTVPNFPYTSHVRHFRDSAAVSDRYAAYFDNFRVDSFLANDKGTTFFLLDGIKT